MVIFISYTIAVILTVIIACTLYPIAGVFYVIDMIGNAVGWISKKAFMIANGAVKYLWSDIARTRIVKNVPNQTDDVLICNNEYSKISNDNLNNDD